MHEKNRIIDEICSVNPSAQRGWLLRFSTEELDHYRQHLQITLEPAVSARWQRRGDLAPVAMRECA